MRVTGTLQRDAWNAKRLPPIEKVRAGLWSLPVPIPQNPLRYTLTYVLEVPGGLVVVDPGWDADAAWTALADGLHRLGAGVAAVRGVVVTHVHPDHHGLSGRLREKSGAWVAMHPVEAASLPARLSADSANGRLGREDEAWLRSCGIPDGVVAELAVTPQALASFLAMAEPDVLLDDGHLVPDTGRRLRAVWTPGHTPGHLCLHDEAAGVLLTGDHVLPRISPNIGLQPHDSQPPLQAYLRSLQRVAELYGDAEILPAHEYRFTGLAHRVRVLLKHHEDRCAEIITALERLGQATVWQLAGELSWSRGWTNVTGFMRRAAVAETSAHLQYLEGTGKLRRMQQSEAGGPTLFERRSGIDPVP